MLDKFLSNYLFLPHVVALSGLDSFLVGALATSTRTDNP